MMQHDDPPFLTVGTEVSAKYKGAFCEAKVNKIVKNVKIKVTFKYGMGSAVLSDDNIKGSFKVGAQVKAFHSEKNQHIDGIINKIQDCSQYTVVFDDGDITTLRRSSLCLKSGRHFAESETLDQLPLTHPEHFGTPVVGGRRGRRSRNHLGSEESSEEEENVHKRHQAKRVEWEADMGKVVCVEIGDKKKQKDNWFPGLVVAPTAQDSVKIETKKDYLVRSFQDGRYYTVPKKEASVFTREVGAKVSQSCLRAAVDKALLYIDKDELPPHWDRDLLFGVDLYDSDLDRDSDSDSSDDEPREEKDHFVAQLYKFMEECGTPINKGPTLGNKDLDLYKLFKVVQKLGGFNRVMNQNQWKIVSLKMGLNTIGSQSSTLVKTAYRRYLQSFDDFYRKLGCTMVSNPRGSRMRHRSGRSLIRDCDKNPRPQKKKGTESCDSTEEEVDKKAEEDEAIKEEVKKEERRKEELKKEERRKEELKKDERRKEELKKDERRKEELKKDERRKEELKKDERRKEELKKDDKKKEELKQDDKRKDDKKKDDSKKEDIKKADILVKKETRRKEIDSVETEKKETKKKEIDKPIAEPDKKDIITRKRENIIAELDKKETRKRDSDLPDTEKKEQEKKKEEIKVQRNRTPPVMTSRTSSPTTRERLREMKTPKSETKVKLFKKEAKEEVSKSPAITSSVKEEKKKDIESEEEIEMAKTRSLRNREEREKEKEVVKVKEEMELICNKEEKEKERPQIKNKDDKERETELIKKTGDRKLKLDHHQRSASCNSTCSGTSSSSSSGTSSSNGNNTDGKSCSKLKMQPSNSLCQLDEFRKRGRRKKLDEDSDFQPEKPNLPPHIPVNVGDKLRVLYGPNNIESKITYEAKVLEVEEDGSQKKFYVHYLGWNTRYDEWVVRQRIAQNLSYNQYRNKKGKALAKEQDRKKEDKDEKDDKKEGSQEGEGFSYSTRRFGMTSLKRGRSVHGLRRDSEKQDVSSSPIQKATTRSDSANHPHSVTPLTDKGEERRRSRRNASSTRDTEDSDSDAFESGAECCSDGDRVRRGSSGHIPSSVSTSPDNLTPEPFNPDSFQEIHKFQIKQENQSPPHISSSCGKDIDLKAIESEMKGLDRPIKKEDSHLTKEITIGICGSTGILTTVIPGSLTITEKKKHDPTKPNDSPAKRVEIPVRLVPAQEIMGHIKPLPISDMKKESLFEDDIYEFKEPEPFEFGEIRSRKENKTKSSGSQEESDCDMKVKKKGRPKKDNDEKSESESDCALTPQKRNVVAKDSKDSPSHKSEMKESPMKIESKDVIKIPEIKKDYSRRVEIKEQVKAEDSHEHESHHKVLNRPRSPTPDLHIKDLSSPGDTGEKPLLIDLLRDCTKSASMTTSIDLKDLKIENIEGKELHMIGTSVVVTQKKMSIKKELMNPECKVELTISKPLEFESPMSLKTLKSVLMEKADDSELLSTRESPKPGLSTDVSSPSKHVTLMTRFPGQPGHVLAQVVMPSTESRALAKVSGKATIDLKPEKGIIAHSDQDTNIPSISKYEEKSDAKMIPFSQRQQHIFPHLLKRSDNQDERGIDIALPTAIVSPSTIPPVTTNILSPPSVSANTEASSSVIHRPHDAIDLEKIIEKARCESTVEESIEAVVSRARQELMQMKEEKKLDLKCYDKRRRNPGRSKKALSREFLPDSSEESDCNNKGDISDHVGMRQKRFKGGDGMSKYSPTKRVSRVITEVDKKHVRQCDDEERANDADEEDNESNFPPLKILSKEADKRRKENMNVAENDVPIHEKDVVKIGLLKKRRRSSAAVKRSDDNEEAGLGDLLCEETIPPGSPMSHDHLTVDTDPPVPPSTIKQEMPFASVPTGSSFSKRGTTASTISSSQPCTGHLHASLQQIHSSVCIQSINQPTSSQPYSSPTIQPNVTITSVRPISHLIPLPYNKTIPITSVPEKSQDAKNLLATVGHSVPSHSKTVISKLVNDTTLQPFPGSSNALEIKVSNSLGNSVVIIPTTRTTVTNSECLEESPKVVNRTLPNIDNTPPTTPESIITTPSDSPRRENEASSKTEDNSTKSGLYSSELEYDKIDNLSEDSNTMDSNSCPGKSNTTKRPIANVVTACNQSHSEGWDTEDGNVTLPKRRKRGSKVRCLSNDPSKDFHKSSHHSFSSSFSCSSGSRRKRLHSNSKANDDEHDFHGVTLLSVAASHMGGRPRYNFCQELDPELDASKRIAVLHNRMLELKRTYMQVKAELASVERRRKKLRKKEREKESFVEAN